MRGLSLLAAIIWAALISSCQSQPNDGAFVYRRIEPLVLEKRPSLDLSQYARFYADDGTGGIFAVYVRGGTHHNGRPAPASSVRWVPKKDQLPQIQDGGCDVVNVHFDEELGGLKSVSCNGEA